MGISCLCMLSSSILVDNRRPTHMLTSVPECAFVLHGEPVGAVALQARGFNGNDAPALHLDAAPANRGDGDGVRAPVSVHSSSLPVSGAAPAPTVSVAPGCAAPLHHRRSRAWGVGPHVGETQRRRGRFPHYSPPSTCNYSAGSPCCDR